jgi:hypothetical protein
VGAECGEAVSFVGLHGAEHLCWRRAVGVNLMTSHRLR